MSMKSKRFISEYEQVRIDKLAKIRELNIDPYGQFFPGVESAASGVAKYDPENEEQLVCAAGRIVLWVALCSQLYVILPAISRLA